MLQYRTAPHSTTSVPPAEQPFNRTIQGKLPILQRNKVAVNRHKEVRQKEDSRQDYNKKYSNDRKNARKSDIKVGDYVFVKQTKTIKLSTKFNPSSYVVMTRNKSEVTARNRNGHVVRRNVSHFKRIPRSSSSTDTDEDDSDEYESVYSDNANHNANDYSNRNMPPRRSTLKTA